MPRSLLFSIFCTFFAVFFAAAQSQESSTPPPQASSQGTAPPPEAKRPKKIWTNENLSTATGTVSVVGDPKNQPKPVSSRPANEQYVASVRKQLDKLQGEITDIDKQLVDLKKFNEGEPSTSASGVKLNKSYEREPIEVQMRALQDKKKDLQSKVDALLDEARKKGVESSQLR